MRYSAGFRLFGNGGVFGYHGRFWSRGRGAYRMHATRRRGLVLLETLSGPVIITPDPQAGFIAILTQRIPGSDPAVSG